MQSFRLQELGEGMRKLLCVAALLLSCGGCERSDGDADAPQAHRVDADPANFTTSGFPRRIYPVDDCDTRIRLTPPFQVSEDGLGGAAIRVPLDLLDDPSMKTTAEEGVNHLFRVSYVFPSRYRGTGMREWFARRAPRLRTLETLAGTLRSRPARLGGGGFGENTYYVGTLDEDRAIAIFCTGTGWRNPVCRAEINTGHDDLRYLAMFPPQAADRLSRVVEIGDELFRDVAIACSGGS